MKSKHYPIAGLLMLCSFGAIAQRQADLSAALLSPQNNSFQMTMTPVSFAVRVVNLGPASILPTDTIGMELILQGDTLSNVANGGSRPFWKETGYTMNRGDTIIITKQISYVQSFEGTIASTCISAFPLLVAGDTVLDNNRSNNTACVSLNFNTPSGIAGSETNDPEVRLYPVPATDFVRVASSRPGSHPVVITDMTGRAWLTTEKYTTGQPINITSLPAGLYQLTVLDSDQRKIVRRLTKR